MNFLNIMESLWGFFTLRSLTLQWLPSSPEGSYTDDANQEVRSPPQQQHAHHHEFDDEFDDDDPLPAIGHCKAIYPFDGEVNLVRFDLLSIYRLFTQLQAKWFPFF